MVDASVVGASVRQSRPFEGMGRVWSRREKGKRVLASLPSCEKQPRARAILMTFRFMYAVRLADSPAGEVMLPGHT